MFIALELLEGACFNEKVDHSCYHDLESLIWVFPYVLAKRATQNRDLIIPPNKGNDRMDLYSALKMWYGPKSLYAMTTTAQGRTMLKTFTRFVKVESRTKELLADLNDALMYQPGHFQAPRKRSKELEAFHRQVIEVCPLSYEFMLAVFNEALRDEESLSEVGKKEDDASVE